MPRRSACAASARARAGRGGSACRRGPGRARSAQPRSWRVSACARPGPSPVRGKVPALRSAPLRSSRPGSGPASAAARWERRVPPEPALSQAGLGWARPPPRSSLPAPPPPPRHPPRRFRGACTSGGLAPAPAPPAVSFRRRRLPARRLRRQPRLLAAGRRGGPPRPPASRCWWLGAGSVSQFPFGAGGRREGVSPHPPAGPGACPEPSRHGAFLLLQPLPSGPSPAVPRRRPGIPPARLGLAHVSPAGRPGPSSGLPAGRRALLRPNPLCNAGARPALPALPGLPWDS